MRFGFIGTSSWAEDVYAGAVSVTENVAFVSVWGRDHGATKESGRTVTAPSTTDVRLALDSALRTLVEMVSRW
jgi:predicted dehydrogenase